MRLSVTAPPILITLCIGILPFLSAGSASGQNVSEPSQQGKFVLSKNADFSTDDRVFDSEDVLYIKIEAPAIDFAGLNVNEFGLVAADDDTNTEPGIFSSFQNQFDGTYTARVELGQLRAPLRWSWYGILVDDRGNEFKGEAEIFIGDPNEDDILVQLRGILEEVGENFIILYDRKIQVTPNTEIISSEGEAIEIADLSVGDEVSVELEFTSANSEELRALKIVRFNNDRLEEVLVTGEISELADRQLVVQNLVFSVNEDTRIVGLNGEELAFNELRVGTLVNVLGQYSADGTLIALLIAAVDDSRGEIAIEGTVEAVNGDSFVVEGVLFLVDNSTVILNELGEVISLSMLQAGQFVEVRAQLGETGLPVAITVKIQENTNGSVFAEGTIEQLLDDGLVVQGRKFLVDNETLVVDQNGQNISFNLLSVGLSVTVIGQYSADGVLMARLIQLRDDNRDEVRLDGIITNLVEGGLIVKDVFFLVTDATIIVDQEGNMLSYRDLAPGMFTEVSGVRSATGQLVATKIHVERGTIVVDGKIERVDEQSLYVGGFLFLVDNETEILGINGQLIRFESLSIGMLVIVEGEIVLVDENGGVNEEPGTGQRVYRATSVHVVQDVAERITVTGAITELGENRFVVDDFVFGVDERTVVVGEGGQEIRYESLQIGMVVEVEAVLTVEGVFVALFINLKDPFPLKISGRIEQINGSIVTLAGVAFEVSDRTEILDVQGRALTVEDLAEGMLARARLVQSVGGGLVATHMRVLRRIEDEVKVSGIVESIMDNAIVVLGRTFYVTDVTVILDESGQPIRLGELSTGRTVAIRADLLPGDGLVALQIQQLEEQVTNIQVTGPVESVESNIIAVMGIFFFTDANTKYYNLTGDSIELKDIVVGETIELVGEGQLDGTRLATQISWREVVVATGRVSDLASNRLSVLGNTYILDDEALVLSDVNAPLNILEIRNGQHVEVRGITANEPGNTDTSLLITKIKVLGQGGTAPVSVEPIDESEYPSSFSLQQNYPNPFNPETTIRFVLSQPAVTTLTIYTILGQEVATLVQGAFQTGEHTIQWNGRDEAGMPVASGMYLYRLQVGAEVQTRQMLLLK